MKIAIAVIATLLSLQAFAERARIKQEQYPQFERYLLLATCASVDMATPHRVREAAQKVERSDSDAMKNVRRGSPYVLEYIGPDNSARLMYLVESILYYGPLKAAHICTQL